MSPQFQPPIEDKVQKELDPRKPRSKQVEEDADKAAQKSSEREKESQKKNNVISH